MSRQIGAAGNADDDVAAVRWPVRKSTPRPDSSRDAHAPLAASTAIASTSHPGVLAGIPVPAHELSWPSASPASGSGEPWMRKESEKNSSALGLTMLPGGCVILHNAGADSVRRGWKPHESDSNSPHATGQRRCAAETRREPAAGASASRSRASRGPGSRRPEPTSG